MPEIQPPKEADIIYRLPDELHAIVGRIIVAFATLEHKLTGLSQILLQLNKPEGRIALRAPRAKDRLEMALDLFAIKDIQLRSNTGALSTLLETATRERDYVAHGIWLKHPDSGEIYLRTVRGAWPKDLSLGDRVSRAIVPQSIPYDVKAGERALEAIEKALAEVDQLGLELDDALHSSPDKFRPPAPVLNPLGIRSLATSPPPPKSSR